MMEEGLPRARAARGLTVGEERSTGTTARAPCLHLQVIHVEFSTGPNANLAGKVLGLSLRCLGECL